MLQPSEDQAAAVANFTEFAADPSQTIFALLGYAGTGKSTAYGMLKEQMSGRVLTVAPTHKAVNVIRRNMRSSGVPYFAYTGGQLPDVHPNTVITATTAQLLGIRPVIADEQDENTMEFGKSGGGMLRSIPGGVNWVVIDEVSMLSADHLDMIEMECMRRGAKLLVIGDPGQLPPVNARAINWDELPAVSTLQKIMRTPDGSAIPLLAAAVRNKEPWRGVMGDGITHTIRPGKVFLDLLSDDGPAVDERERDVFIAYTNQVVDEVQELACRQVYGHGRHNFLPGQIVTSEMRFEAVQETYMEKYGRSYPRAQVVAQNADDLRVLGIGERGRWGTQVELARIEVTLDFATGERRIVEGMPFAAEYLSEDEKANRNHPWNVAVREAMAKANALQKEWKADHNNKALNARRVAAWSDAFELKDRTVIQFRHPFAITSHKSQGSTYRNAFVDASDIERFPETSAQSLYVAATRPAEQLVIG